MKTFKTFTVVSALIAAIVCAGAGGAAEPSKKAKENCSGVDCGYAPTAPDEKSRSVDGGVAAQKPAKQIVKTDAGKSRAVDSEKPKRKQKECSDGGPSCQ